jgi:hypothetical protein
MRREKATCLLDTLMKLGVVAPCSIWETTATFAESSLENDRTKIEMVAPLCDGGTTVRAIFDFPGTVKFGGTFRSADGKISAITTAPATKSGFVHIAVRLDNGDLLFLTDINERVARLLKGQAAEGAENWLLATGISGRKVFLSAIEGESPGVRREYNFAIRIGERGEIFLASRVTLKLPHSD